ncbi:hypothetical protein QEN19_001531 [Hanseniaspora menglaensis]
MIGLGGVFVKSTISSFKPFRSSIRSLSSQHGYAILNNPSINRLRWFNKSTHTHLKTLAKSAYSKKQIIKSSKTTNELELKALFKQIYNIPNMITSLRIISTPVISYFLYNQDYKIFISLFVLSSITDFLDGFIARRYNLKTKLGSIIDPLADKLLIVSTVISMSLIGGPEIIPGWLSASIILKDIILLTKTGIQYQKNKALGQMGDIKPTFISKFNTFLQLLYIGPICFWMLYKRENEEEPEENKVFERNRIFEYFGYVVGATTLLSGLSYIGPLCLRKFLI